MIVVFPLTTLILGEIIYWLRSRHKTLVATIRILRDLILPSLAVFILLNKILGLSADQTPLRIVQTILWICIIHAALTSIDGLLFSDAKVDT